MSGRLARFMISAAAAAVKSAPLAALLACASPALGADWPMFMGNPERTSHITEQAAPPLTDPWYFQADGSIVSSPAVYDGRVYIGSRANKIYALDAATGVKLWERLTAGWVDSSPAVSGNAVYAACLGGRLYALDRINGALLWIVDLGAGSVSSPLVLDGRVYVGTGSPENKLKVYDAATGAFLGSYPAPQPVDSAPSTDGDSVYFGANDGSVYALDPVSLAERWPPSPNLGSFGHNAVAVSSGVLYFLPGRDEKRAASFAAVEGMLLSSSTALAKNGPWMQAASPAVDGQGFVYFIAGAATGTEASAQLAALSSGTMSRVWPSSVSLGGVSPIGVLASPALANNVIYAATPDSRLIVVTSTGGPLQELNISSPAYSSPAVSNGRVVVANFGGRVFGYRAGRRTAISSPAGGAVLAGTVAVSGYYDSPDLSGFELEFSTGGAAPSWTLISSAATAAPVSGANIAVWNVSDLEKGEYLLRLRTLEDPVSIYDASAIVAVRVNAPPLPPSDLQAQDVDGDNGNAIDLVWTASPTGGIQEYRVYRDDGYGFVLYASTPGISYRDSAAVTGSTFAYAVSAWDGWAASERTEEVFEFSVNNSGDTISPAAIADLSAVPGFSGGGVALVWTAPGDDGTVGEASHYLVRYSTYLAAFSDSTHFDSLAGSSRPVDGPAGITESDEYGGLYGGVTYYFALKAVDDVGNTAELSNIGSTWAAYDLYPPLPPSGLSVADTPRDEGGNLDLSWSLSPDDGAGAGDVYGYRIFRRTLNTSFVSTAPYASVGAGVSSYRDTDATLRVRYYYAVAAFDSTNNSVLTPESSGISADNWRFFNSSRDELVSLTDGTEVALPADSASQNDKVMIYRLDPVTHQRVLGAKAAAAARPTDIVYEVSFQNQATRLLAPARISLPYTDAEVAGMQTENLRLYTLSGSDWLMLNGSEADPAAKKVSGEVSRFSIFSIMEYVPSGDVFGDSEVYTYPNPAKGDTVTFKFRVAYKSYVKIDVYNVAGEKVAFLEKADCPAGDASEIIWNVRGIASGVYVYRLEAQSSAGSKSVIKKLAVIH